ncbi:MAG TPA: C45 family autoproteolytic acyltransferase/hydrolase [Kofleriaceae bacterium]|nr:C45 family autoproteolytic acyltransferase/hydrolase [Kofleriaceae bacterium]
MTDPTAREPLTMIRLAGTQAEMGAQHGRLVAADAARLLAFYRSLPERALAGDMRGAAGAVGRTLVRTVATTWQARLQRERPAELAARSRAFVDAVRAAEPSVGSRRDGLLAMAAMDALQNCVSLVARARLGPFGSPLAARAAAAAAPACSTAIAWGDATDDGELLFARNFDFPGIGVWDVAPAFVVCAPAPRVTDSRGAASRGGAGGQRYGFFATRGADTPVVTVVNEAGLVLAPHTRWHRGVSFGGAMIVDFVHDIARRAETLADAIAIAREHPPSSSWGLAIGSAREKTALVLEAAGRALEIVRPAPGASFLVCTNRYRSAALQDGQVAASPAWAIHSDRRERRLRALVEARTKPLDAATLARFLGDRVDPDAPETGARRLGSMLAQPTNVHAAVVAPSRRRALVGVDRAPSCEGTWAELAWSWDGPTGAWQLGDDAAARAGFEARERTDIAAPHDAATRHVQAAARAYESDHDVATARVEIERAVAIDPDDPSLRLAAAWLALADGAHDRAREHAHAGLAHETEGYRREQLQAAASWPRGKRAHVNLMMTDAYA